jgi:RHS repeat-associated protein
LKAVTTNSGGATTVTHNYYPYGEEITSTSNDQYKFASTYRDSNSGLDYAVNRYHGSGRGRFLSADPYEASGGPASPQSWNRYSYVRGDPVNFRDPRGLLEAPPDGFCPAEYHDCGGWDWLGGGLIWGGGGGGGGGDGGDGGGCDGGGGGGSGGQDPGVPKPGGGMVACGSLWLTQYYYCYDAGGCSLFQSGIYRISGPIRLVLLFDCAWALAALGRA